MKRIALILATVGILCLAAGNAQAGGPHHGYGGHHGGYYPGGYHGGYRYNAVVVRPPVCLPPPVIARYPVYPPVYRYNYYYPAPAYGFYYQSRGLSIGVGF
jgi:hypothetical protein